MPVFSVRYLYRRSKTMKRVTNEPGITISTEQQIRYAWHFAHAALWQEDQFSDKEIQRANIHLANYFDRQGDPNSVFIAFCERVIIGGLQSAAERYSNLPHPSIWLQPGYRSGFAATAADHTFVIRRRVDDPGYMQEISILAQHYLQYAITPSVAILSQCRKQLLAVKAYHLARLFYYAVIYSQL